MTPCPPERDLASDFGVSRITVRKAIDGLVERGHAVAPPGFRHVRARALEKNFSKLTSFSEDMRCPRPQSAQRVAAQRPPAP